MCARSSGSTVRPASFRCLTASPGWPGSPANNDGSDQVKPGHVRPYPYTPPMTASLSDSHAGPPAGGIWPLSVSPSYSCAPLRIASTPITASPARPAAYSTRIYKTYGQDAVKIVQENPYRLAQDVRGIGFITADKIARQMRIDEHSPRRAQAALEYLLLERAGEGHVFTPNAELVQMCQSRFDLPEELLTAAVGSLRKAGRIVLDGEAVFLRGLYLAERAVADSIRSLMASPGQRREFDAPAAVDWASRRMGMELTQEQRQAVHEAVSQKVFVLTGGPGTGKTTILRAVILVLEALGQRVVLAAPTGRAAKRLGEAAGREAKTLHRLLEFKPGEGRFGRDAERPLNANAVVIDETSMLDIVLCHHLLQAVPRHASVLFVGDANQLPSVGPGKFLGDVLESGVVPFLRLERIFRQGERSGIVDAAHRVNQGRLPSLASSGSQRNFYFVDAGEPAAAANAVVRICAARIPARFGLRPMRDVQVLCPMNRGDIGVHRLNDRLREALNPAGTEVTRFGRTFRVGDRVLQSVNNYDKDVFNGDLGWVAGVDHAAGRITVNFGETGVEYDFPELDELQPSFAMTVHRAQGGEFPAVVVPLLTQHCPMLQRNLLYTAITRGRRLVVVVGSRRALVMAVRNDRPGERNSMLRVRLSGTETGGGTAFPEGGFQRLGFL